MIFDLFEAAQEFLSEITPSHVSASTVSQFSHGFFFLVCIVKLAMKILGF